MSMSVSQSYSIFFLRMCVYLHLHEVDMFKDEQVSHQRQKISAQVSRLVKDSQKIDTYIVEKTSLLGLVSRRNRVTRIQP